jgi:phosphatidylglycerophosphatase A
MKPYKAIASVGGIGHIKGGGTIAAIVTCAFRLLFINHDNDSLQLSITIFVCAIGVIVSNNVDAVWGKDSSKVVIDEVAGMMVTLLFIPISWKSILIGLILFRLFDITKPLFIKRLEKLPKGWGVMADDLLAGIYSNVLLRIIVSYKILGV